MEPLRALQIMAESTPSVTRTCASCYRTTREGKDYCTVHVEHHPYIYSLLNQIKNREQEDSLVRRKGSAFVNMEGITVNEILLCLRRGTKTEERLSREILLDKTVIHNYLVHLSAEGIIKFGRTSRNNISVCLSNYDPSTEIVEDDE